MRLIDADALAEDLEYDVEMDSRALDCTDLVGVERERTLFDKVCKQNCLWCLTESPTIYAVPVVRCWECKYYFGDGLGICEMIKSRLAACQRDVRWNDEFYCAYGERKDGDRDG